MSTGLELEHAAGLVGELRAERPPIDWTGLPLELEPGVSEARRHPFLKIVVGGETVGQWEAAEALRHAAGALQAIETVRLDQALAVRLATVYGTGVETAQNVVSGLSEHRWEGEQA